MRLRFGTLTFDAGTRQLRRDGADVHLSPKAFDLLELLISRRPLVVSKRELHDRLWPGTFVSEGTLPGLVSELRTALRDSARKPVVVRTVHRVGYAFLAEVSALPDSGPAAPPQAYCWLVIKGRRVPLQAGDNILGRTDDAIELRSPLVSRRHARIVIRGTEAVLEDLDSKNGTFLGGKRVSNRPVRLKDGDEIAIGSIAIHFRMTAREGSTATGTGADRLPARSGPQRRRPVEDHRDA